MIQALQAVASYPESRDFLLTVSRTLPGLQKLLDVPLQPDGQNSFASQGPRPSTADPSALSPVSTRLPISDEEPGRKRTSPHEVMGPMSTNDSPTSRLLPDKHQNDNIPRSFVTPEPPKVGYTDVPKPQMSNDEVLERS